MGTGRLEARLLGRAAFRVDGHPAVEGWPRPSARRLFSLLVLSRSRRRAREELAEALYAHLPPDRAARSVSKALSMARSVLPDGVLEADRTNVWIAEDIEVSCDLEDLTGRLRGALDLPAGPARIEALTGALAVTGVPIADDPYEDWAIEVRDEVERLRQAARVARARGTGDVADWMAVANHDPASEGACLALAKARAAVGDRDGIVRAFDRCRQAVTDLGLEPSPELAARIRELLGRTQMAQPRVTSTLIGRAEELDRVCEHARGTGPAGRGTAIVTGPAGVGKSRLIDEATRRLQADGWHVTTGTASPDDHLAPMVALRTVLAGVLPERSDPLARRLAQGTGARRGSAAGLAQLADEIDAALAQIASDGALAVVVDDVQWCDVALKRLLVRLAQRRARSWTLLMGARTDEPGAPIPELGSSAEELRLGPVDRPAATQIVRAELPDADPDVVADLVDRGAGNPFFLVELARHARTHRHRPAGAGSLRPVADVPDRVMGLLRDRIASVSVDARRLLEHLAALGEDASYEVIVSDEIGVGPDGETVDELIAGHLARETHDGVRLIHPLLRDTVLADTNAIRRGTIHTVVARRCEGLADRDSPNVDRYRLVAARHRVDAYRQGGRLPDAAGPAARAGFQAGRLAIRLLADEAAEELYVGALEAFESLDAPRRGELARGAANAWIALGNLRAETDDTAGEDAYRTALGLAVDDLQRARCWRGLEWLAYRAGDLARAAEVCEEGLDALGPGDPVARALLQIELGWILHRGGHMEEAVPVLEEAAEVCEEAGEWGLAARALDRLGMALDGVGRLEDGLSTLQRAAQACARTRSDRLRAAIDIHTASLLRLDRRFEAAQEHITDAARLADEIGDVYTRSVAHWINAEILHDIGDVNGALAERDAEVTILTDLANDLNLAGAHAHRARLLLELGRFEEAAQAADAAREAAVRTQVPSTIDDIEAQLVGVP